MKKMWMTGLFFLLCINSVTVIATPGTMKVDQVHVNTWNTFSDNLYRYHLYQLQQHDVEQVESYGGYAGKPRFYREIEYIDRQSKRLLSKIQWEVAKPDQIHMMEVYVYDTAGKLQRDYLVAWLPEYRNAPIQTLINLHYQNDELKSYRQFDASGARIYEQCQGNHFGKQVMFSLEEDEMLSSAPASIALLESEEYLACFNSISAHVGQYLDPMRGIAAAGYDGTDANEIEKQIEQISRRLPDSNNKAKLYTERGNAWFKLHEFSKAVDDFTLAIKQNPEHDDARFGRGMALGRMGLVEKGIADLSVYIERNPRSSHAYTKRGVRYIWAGQLDKAKSDLSTAILLNPKNAEAHDDLGVLYARKGKYSRAMSHFQKVIEADPLYQKGYHNLAMVLFITKQSQKALQTINKALELSANNKNSLLLKGAILQELGMNGEAKRVTERAEFLPDGNWSESFSIQ